MSFHFSDGTPDAQPEEFTTLSSTSVFQTDTGIPPVLSPTISTSTPTTGTPTPLGVTLPKSIVLANSEVTSSTQSSRGGVSTSVSPPSNITDVPPGTPTSVELPRPTTPQLTERQKPVSVMLIVGAILGGVVLAACMVFVLCHYRRRRKRREIESARPMVFEEERVPMDYKSKLHLESLGMRCNSAAIGTSSPVGFADGRVDHTVWASAGSSMYYHEDDHATLNPNASEGNRQVRTTADEGPISPDLLRQFIEGLGLTSDVGGGDTGRIHPSSSQPNEPPPRYR